SGPRKPAVRCSEPSLSRTTPCSTNAAQGRKSARLWARRRYSVRFIMTCSSRGKMLRIAKMPSHDVDEGGVALGGPDGCQVTDQPDRGTGQPQAQAEADSGSKGAIEDHDGSRRPTQQEGFRQGPMDGRVKARNGLTKLHQTSAPPPNEKNDRKKL